MAVDWLSIQSVIRGYRPRFLSARALTASRIEHARHADAGEQARQIDAAVRDIANSRHGQESILGAELEMRLTDLEKDILAIRLDWAFQVSEYMLSKDGQFWPFGEELTEDEFEHLLTDVWREYGRENYQTAQQKIDALLQSKGIPPIGETPPPSNGSFLR
jgi:hypothetical protein